MDGELGPPNSFNQSNHIPLMPIMDESCHLTQPLLSEDPITREEYEERYHILVKRIEEVKGEEQNQDFETLGIHEQKIVLINLELE